MTVIEPMIGGGGGRPGRDGIDGCDASLGFLKTTPAETLEAEVPIVVRRFHLIPDSAGPGRFRGGFARAPGLPGVPPRGPGDRARAWSGCASRRGAWRAAPPARRGSVVLNPGTAGERPLPKIDVLALEPGDVLSVRTPGGGGHGDPLRAAARRRCSPTSRPGLVSREHAREAYGVVLAGDRVDETATAALRAARRARADAGDEHGRATFDFGPARREHERRWPPALQDAFIELLMSLPAPYRAYVRRTLHARVAALADQRPVTPDDLHRLWQELRGAIGLA